MEGWIKLHRALLESDIWKSEEFSRGQAWVDLLLLANHKDSYFMKRGNKIDVKRGQIGHSMKALSDRWRWSVGKVNRFLKMLENEKQISIKKTQITTILTVIKYSEYQQDEKQTKNRRKTDGKQTETYKNDNNDNNEKNITPLEAVKTNSNDEKFLKFCDWIGENLEYIPTMKTQITEKEFNKILENHDPQKVADKLDRMDIWFSGLPDNDKARKRTKVYPTLRGFLKD